MIPQIFLAHLILMCGLLILVLIIIDQNYNHLKIKNNKGDLITFIIDLININLGVIF